MKEIKVILIVDDETSILKSYGRRLQGEFDVTVLAAENLTEMVRKVGEVPPDLVLMDGQIRQENGVDGIIKLRAIGSNAPVVSISANGDIVEQMILQGAVGSIEKSGEVPRQLNLLMSALGYTLTRTSR